MPEQPDGPDLTQGVEAASLKDGGMIAGRVGDQPVVLACTAGKLYAVSGECTHVGAPLQDGVVEGGVVRCPWHHAQFDLATGCAVGAPAFEPLGCYEVEQKDGRVFVKNRKPARTPSSAPGKTTQVVIIGGGAAGFACADWLSRSDFDGRVTMISDDADPPYDRTFCSKDYLEGKAPRSDCFLAAQDFYDGGKIALKLQSRATFIDLPTRTVGLEAGEALSFDTLVLATGCAAKTPTFPGSDHPNVHCLRTLRDADALISEMDKGRRAAVIGGSFIALETAAALIERGLQVHVIAPEDVLLKSVMGEAVGRFIQRLHVEKGANLHLGKQVERFDGRRLEISGGMALEVDFVAAGVGVSPRVELAQQAGLTVDDGVVVDARLLASADGVYAVGDVARYPDPLTGELIRTEHWVHAERQGQHVARGILGHTAPFTDPPFFWSAHYGTGVRFVGRSNGFDAVDIDGDLSKTPATDVTFVAQYKRNGALAAVSSYNDDKAVLEAELVLERMTTGPEKAR